MSSPTTSSVSKRRRVIIESSDDEDEAPALTKEKAEAVNKHDVSDVTDLLF